MSVPDHRLIHTSSSGQNEVRAALAAAHARGSRTIDNVRLLRRHFGPKVLLTDLNTVLAALVGAGDALNPSGTLYKLTDAGLVKARARPRPRHIPGVW